MGVTEAAVEESGEKGHGGKSLQGPGKCRQQGHHTEVMDGGTAYRRPEHSAEWLWSRTQPHGV